MKPDESIQRPFHRDRFGSPTSIRCLRLLGQAPLVAVLAIAGRAQAPCFQASPLSSAGAPANTNTPADVDGDGFPDLVVTYVFYQPPSYIIPATMHVVFNQGGSALVNPTLVYASPFQNEELRRVRPVDVDGDGDLDLAVLSVYQPYGAYSAEVSIWRNDGTGAFTSGPRISVGNSGSDIAVADLDPDSHPDILINDYVPTGTVQILRNDGTGAFTPQFWPAPGSHPPYLTATGDVDGDGDVDVIATMSGSGGGTDVLLNTGSGSFVVGSSLSGFGTELADLDGDGDLDLPSVVPFIWVRVMQINQGNGTFVPGWSGNYTWDGFWRDLDADGDVDFVDQYSSFLVNQGNGTFVSAPTYPGIGLYAVLDFDNDGDMDILRASEILSGCSFAGTLFCAGDGSGTACPCGNASPASARAGCLNSLGSAGRLRGNGTARISADTFRLLGTGMTNAAALYFQGTTQVSAGAGAVFGDGLRCAGGSIVRLATKPNASGVSEFPASGDPMLHVRGQVNVPGTRTYQVWYRNAITFCTSATYNLTNGLQVSWAN